MVNDKLRNPRSGFTLIELLIVITIIGVLVVGILAAINPVEQVRRAQDQGTESDASELLKALDRYYTAFFEYPWEGATPACSGGAPYFTLVQTCWLNELKTRGEIKDVFVSRTSWSKIRVTQSGTVIHACFSPTSSTFKKQANDAGYDQYGNTGCTTNCWDCLPR